jgi:hypothetical protein
MAGLLEVTIGRPDAKAMRHYRYMWTVTLDGHTLGWGHTNRQEEAEIDAMDLAADVVNPDELKDIRITNAASCH